MDKKAEILRLLHEEFGRWQVFLGALSEARATAVAPRADRSIKDDVAHLWAWQGRTVARLQAAADDHDPYFGGWPPELEPENEEDLERVNTWMYEINRGRPWAEVYGTWQGRFVRLLDLAAEVPGDELVDKERYPWLDGYSLYDVLWGTWDHHREHYDDLAAR